MEVLLRIDQTQTPVVPLFSAHQECLSSLSATFQSQNPLADHPLFLKSSQTLPQPSTTTSVVGHVVYITSLNGIVGDSWHGSLDLDSGIIGWKILCFDQSQKIEIKLSMKEHVCEYKVTTSFGFWTGGRASDFIGLVPWASKWDK